jgi:hypothetical protein
MGIGLKRGSPSWSTVVAKNLAEDDKRVSKGATPRFYTPPLMNNNNILTSEKAEEFILAHKIPRLSNGDPVASTERGRRRSQRNGK